MLNELTGNGRLWIHAAQRRLSAEEQKEINAQFSEFLKGWAAHGKSLKASFEILYDQLLILAVDEGFEQATGCSIDSSVQVVRAVDQRYDLDLFNRLNLTFLEDGAIRIVPMFELNKAYQQGLIDAESIFLDNSISSLTAFRNNWQLPFKDSWAFKKIKQLA